MHLDLSPEEIWLAVQALDDRVAKKEEWVAYMADRPFGTPEITEASRKVAESKAGEARELGAKFRLALASDNAPENRPLDLEWIREYIRQAEDVVNDFGHVPHLRFAAAGVAAALYKVLWHHAQDEEERAKWLERYDIMVSRHYDLVVLLATTEERKDKENLLCLRMP